MCETNSTTGSTARIGVFRELLAHLQAAGYTFICPSPETQMRVVAPRSLQIAQTGRNTLEDVFGWSLEIQQEKITELLPAHLFQRLCHAGVLYQKRSSGPYKSSVRVSDLHLSRHHYQQSGNGASSPSYYNYYLHSAFPVTQDSAFFGPDTYLFLDFLALSRHHLSPRAVRTIVDVCCGPGAGAIHMARGFPRAGVIGLDLNDKALELAGINAALALPESSDVRFCRSHLFSSLPGLLPDGVEVDVIVANPPYIASKNGGRRGDTGPTPMYADGGASLGLEMSMSIVQEGIRFLASGGILLLYTGVTIVAASPGHDPFLTWILAQGQYQLLDYGVCHPDMWPEEIGNGAYVDAARIQVVGAALRKRIIKGEGARG